MKKAGFSKKLQNSSHDPDDIPVAIRDTPVATPKVWLQPRILLIGGVAGFFLLALISGFLFFLTTPRKTANSEPSPASSAPPTPTVSNNSNNTLLGHLAYSQAPESELVTISGNRGMRMRKSAAQKFQEMVATARSANVILVPISAFRSVKDQEQLFFGLSAQRNQTPAVRAALSAPPGHSEHHTGYAVDIGDGAAPATNLETNFEKTKAYQWLQTNAARFGFEMSFAKNNVQGVSYEPWHWRFVGDRDSLETFYRARNLKPTPVTK
ncbi:MAG: D-alanyl-D-alanine carboxypeptidase family protein [Nostoc sp. SerVER01]|nr:D-alanyl-D-alanine carboxypeptidase family protein [Nostoc sp. SerVER01]MDZ8029102.1 D-alanyl-D-alanine carboxypeptidase family protein [Nostoc sp. DedQUE11]MDZ8076490.1 D-alanyl-D-alanine carboxypeptidase family protein [Nostoc sp. DedQUE01]MDZ8083785.1 D-alanyl-D-alanine carboxypeptidase family protein [Nostoc sp. DcaGUA01]